MKPQLPITVRTGDDAEIAERFKSLYTDAQNGLRRVVSFGIFAWQVKLHHLKHGQFIKWCKQHFPDTSYRSVNAHMVLAESAMRHAGIKSLRNFIKNQMCSTLHISHCGEFLLLSDAKVPDALKPVRDKVFNIIDGKSQRQLFAEFKQADDDDDSPKPKRGRLKGQGGASAEQRAKAAEREEAARIETIELDAEDFCKWLDENCDDKHIGQIHDAPFNKLFDTLETAVAYMGIVRKARRAAREKGGKE